MAERISKSKEAKEWRDIPDEMKNMKQVLSAINRDDYIQKYEENNNKY